MSIRLSVDSVRDPNTLVQALESVTRFIPEIRWFRVLFPTINAPLSIYHKIGRTPLHMIADAIVDVLPGTEVVVIPQCWATLDDRNEWGPERVVVRCSQSGVTVDIGLIV